MVVTTPTTMTTFMMRPAVVSARKAAVLLFLLFLVTANLAVSQQENLRNPSPSSSRQFSSSSPPSSVHAAIRPLLSGSLYSSHTAAQKGTSAHGRRLQGILGGLFGSTTPTYSTSSAASGLLNAGNVLLSVPTSVLGGVASVAGIGNSNNNNNGGYSTSGGYNSYPTSANSRSMTDTITGGLSSTISSMLTGFNPATYTELFSEIPLIGNLLSDMTSIGGSVLGSSGSSGSTVFGIPTGSSGTTVSQSSLAPLGSIVEALLGTRELNSNLFGGLNDALAAYTAIPLLGQEVGQSAASAADGLNTLGASGLFGIGGLLNQVARDGISVLSNIDNSILSGASAGTTQASPLFKSSFGDFSIMDNMVAGQGVSAVSDEQMLAQAYTGRQQTTLAMDYSTAVQGRTNSLLSLFTGGMIMPLSIGLLLLQNAVQTVISSPSSRNSWEQIIKALSVLRLDASSLPNSFLLNSSQTNVVQQGVGIIDQLLALISSNNGSITGQFLNTFSTLLGSLGQNFLRLDQTSAAPRVYVGDLDVTVNLFQMNLGELTFPFNFSNTMPFLLNSFGLVPNVIATMIGAGASLGIQGFTQGLQAFGQLIQPFVVGGLTAATVLRSLISNVLMTMPSMFLDAVAQNAVLGAVQKNVEMSLNLVTTTPVNFALNSINDVVGGGVDSFQSTDYFEKLFGTGDGVFTVAKLLGVENTRYYSNNLSGVLGSQSSIISEVFQLPTTLLTEFFSGGLSMALGVMGAMLNGGGAIGSGLFNAFANLFTGGLNTFANLATGGNNNNNNPIASTTNIYDLTLLSGGGGNSNPLALLNPLSLLTSSPARSTTSIQMFPGLFGSSARRLQEEGVAAAAAAAATATVGTVSSGGAAAAAAAATTVSSATGVTTGTVTTSVTDVEGVTLNAAAAGLASVYVVVGNLLTATLSKPCVSAKSAAGSTLLNAAAVVGNPTRLLQEVGVSTDEIQAAVTLNTDTVAAAATPTTAELQDPVYQLCEAKAKALEKLLAFAQSQQEFFEQLEQLSLTQSLSEVNVIDKLLESADCVVPTITSSS